MHCTKYVLDAYHHTPYLGKHTTMCNKSSKLVSDKKKTLPNRQKLLPINLLFQQKVKMHTNVKSTFQDERQLS